MWMRRLAALACLAAAQQLARQYRMRRALLATAVGSARRFFEGHLDRFCDAPFDEARFVDRARLSPLGPRTGVVLTVDAATDTRTQRRVVLKAGATFADHLAGDLLPALLNVSGEHVLTAEACFHRGARDRVAAYGKMDGNLLQLLAANETGPLRQYVPRRRDRSCFVLRAMHQLLRGLAAAVAVGIVNQDVHAGNLLFAGAGPAMRWKISDFGRACVVGAGRCPHMAGSRALAPEAGHVRRTPASDVWSAGFVFLLLRCGGDWGDRRALREWLLRLNEEYGATRKRLGGRDTTAVPIIAWNATSFSQGSSARRPRGYEIPPPGAGSSPGRRGKKRCRRRGNVRSWRRCWTCAGRTGRRRRSSRATSATWYRGGVARRLLGGVASRGPSATIVVVLREGTTPQKISMY